MLVNTMTEQEIHREVIMDLMSVVRYVDKYGDKEYRRAVLKASRFPFYMHPIERKTPQKNTWYLLYQADSKKVLKGESRVSFVTVVESSIGKQAIFPSVLDDKRILMFFAPHFFARYKQRFGVEKTGIPLILHFFRTNFDFAIDMRERRTSETTATTDVFAACADGIALGSMSVSGNVLFRTFITREMLRGQQIEEYIRIEEVRREMSGQ